MSSFKVFPYVEDKVKVPRLSLIPSMWRQVPGRKGKYYFGDDSFSQNTREVSKNMAFAIIGVHSDPVNDDPPSGNFTITKTPVSVMWISECAKYALYPPIEEFDGHFIPLTKAKADKIWYPRPHWPEYAIFAPGQDGYCFKARK
jgi:hypothetical protein